MHENHPSHKSYPNTHALLKRHVGVWNGTYTHLDTHYEVLDQHDYTIKAECPDDDSCDYRQTSHYNWDDGRVLDFVFEASFNESGDRLIWDDGRIAGELWAITPDTIYLHFSYTAEPHIKICEMMQLSACGTHRARTWHWMNNEKLFKITLVKEFRA